MSKTTITDIKTLIQTVSRGKKVKYVYFWGHTSKDKGSVGKECLSQWYPASFDVDGVIYRTAEHYMMAGKARLFGDEKAVKEILAAGSPTAAKQFGRCISPFCEKTWVENRMEIVVKGNLAKFGQHAALKEFLLGTGDRILVEASPADRIWGIGLAQDDPKAGNPALWKGQNLLGFALMKVRDELRKG